MRLIAAGLRHGGVRTWAKVTGTLPNLIDENGDDIPIVRGSPPSIIEQRAVVAKAAASRAQAVVMECMALEPAFQRAEEWLLRPTIGVITNIRLDHEEVFGSSLVDIAHALSNTVPHGGMLVTTSGEGLRVLRDVARGRRTSLTVVETNDLPDSLTEGFSYIEHKENIALALAVCERAGVAPEVALQGMRSCIGDPGALRIHSRTSGGKTLHFINAMAANDPESTMLLFQRTVVGQYPANSVIVLVNSRKDRPLRSRQLGRVLANVPAQRYFLIGDDSDAVMKGAIRGGIGPEAIELLQTVTAAEVIRSLYSAVEGEGVVFAMGNTAGLGLEVSRYFAAAD